MPDRGRAPDRPDLPDLPAEESVAELRAELAAIRARLDEAVQPRDRPAPAAVPSGRPPRSGGWRAAVVLGILLALVAVLVALVAARAVDGGSGPAAGLSAAPTAAPAGAPGSVVTARLSPEGLVDVREDVVLPRPADHVLLELPDPAAVPGSRLRAPEVIGLTATAGDRPLRVDGYGGRWDADTPDGSAVVRIRLAYRLSGAVVATGDSGRALLAVTPLTGRLSRSAGAPVRVRLVGVRARQATCLGATVAEQLCGSPGAGGWTATVPASSPVPFVVFQVDLP